MSIIQQPQAHTPLAYVKHLLATNRHPHSNWHIGTAELDWHLSVGEKARSINDVKAEVVTEYRCTICGEHYSTLEAAKECSRQLYGDGGLEVGDLVIVPSEAVYYYENTRFSSYTEDPWCAFIGPGDPDALNHFDQKTRYFQWFVVTAIHFGKEDRHNVVVTLCTYMDGRFQYGWNPANGLHHDAMFRAGVPEHQQRCNPTSTWWKKEMAGVKFSDLVLSAKYSPQLLQETGELADLRISSNKLL